LSKLLKKQKITIFTSAKEVPYCNRPISPFFRLSVFVNEITRRVIQRFSRNLERYGLLLWVEHPGVDPTQNGRPAALLDFCYNIFCIA